MKTLSLFALIIFVLSACVPKSELDEANKTISELKSQIVAAHAETEKIKAQVFATQTESNRIRSEAELAKNENQSLVAKNSQLQAKVDEKPKLPVTVSFRKAVMGPGNVAIFNTTIKAQVPILITVHSASLGTTKQFERHLSSTQPTELGHLEGAVIDNGDTITIENQNYSPFNITVSL